MLSIKRCSPFAAVQGVAGSYTMEASLGGQSAGRTHFSARDYLLQGRTLCRWQGWEGGKRMFCRCCVYLYRWLLHRAGCELAPGSKTVCRRGALTVRLGRDNRALA